MEPSLTHALRSHVLDKDGQLLERYDHEHYFIGYDKPEKHAGFFRLPVAAADLAISPSSLNSLRGRCLSVRHVPRIDDPLRTREILVATSPDEAT